MPGPPMAGYGAALVIFWGLVIVVSIVGFYVVVSVAVERSPGWLVAFLLIGLAVTYLVFRP